MHSTKLIGNKIKEAEVSINKKPASTLRKKLSAIDPTPPLDIQQSYLEFSIKNKREMQDKRIKDPKNDEISLKKDVYMTPNNKIYNAKNNKHIDHANDSGLHPADKVTKMLATNRGNEFEMRPKSSNTDKYQKSIEIHNINNGNIKHQVRPGSSKSSRLFKKKSSTMVNDDMKSQNDEDDSFIKITNREKDFANNSTARERQRIGTSLSKKTRGGLDKFQSKLDPQFFNLFAS